MLVPGAIGLAVFFMAFATPSAAQQPPPAGYRTGVTLLEVAVSARDRSGRFLPGLRQEDFLLEVGGREVPIETFVAVTGAPAKEAEGRFLLLVLDDIGCDPTLTPRIKSIAHDVIRRMAPGDEAAVLTFNGDNMTSTADPEHLHARIDAFTHASDLGPMLPAEHALTTMRELADQLARVQRRRKAIVVVGSTVLFDLPEPMPGARVTDDWQTSIRTLARANVVVYVIDPRPVVSGLHMGDTGFAWETGGTAIRTNLVDRAIDQMWADLGNYYLLGYSMTETEADRRSPLRVRARRPGVLVSARRTAF